MDIELYEDPFDYPDWRWTRVKALISENKEPGPSDDKFIHRTFQFRKEHAACDGSNESRIRLASKYREVSKAVSLANNKSDRKHYIEAFTLCPDMTDEQIAQYMGEHPNTIRYYVKLFFDVRHKIDNPGYVCSRVLEPAVIKSIQDLNDTSIGWKMAALFGGSGALKVFWEKRAAPREVARYFKGVGDTALLKAYGTGNYLRPVNKYNIDAITGHVLKIAELEIQKSAAMGRGGDMAEERLSEMKDMVESISFHMARPDDPVVQREPRLHEKVDPALLAAVIGEQHEH